MILEHRVDQASVWGMVFVAGWIAASAYYEIPNLWEKKATLEHVEAVVLPKANALVKCEHHRASESVMQAAQAVAAAETPSVPIPDLRDLPDCPHK